MEGPKELISIIKMRANIFIFHFPFWTHSMCPFGFSLGHPSFGHFIFIPIRAHAMCPYGILFERAISISRPKFYLHFPFVTSHTPIRYFIFIFRRGTLHVPVFEHPIPIPHSTTFHTHVRYFIPIPHSSHRIHPFEIPFPVRPHCIHPFDIPFPFPIRHISYTRSIFYSHFPFVTSHTPVRYPIPHSSHFIRPSEILSPFSVGAHCMCPFSGYNFTNLHLNYQRSLYFDNSFRLCIQETLYPCLPGFQNHKFWLPRPKILVRP